MGSYVHTFFKRKVSFERKNQRYASRMECLCKIHDGSEHEIGDGYWLAKAVAADIEHKKGSSD